MSTQTNLMTAEELLASPLNQNHCELINGEVIVMSPSGFEHGAIVVRLTEWLSYFVRTHQLGFVLGAETGFIITRDPDTVRAPDVAYVSNERLKATGMTKKFFPGAPDLAVEVVSPDDRPRAVREKALQWLASGAQAVWVVDPEPCNVTVYLAASEVQTLAEDETLTGGAVLPGFRYLVRDIFFSNFAP